MKYEEVYLNEYISPRQARQGIERYLSFYNQERPHQSLDYRTPAELYYQRPVAVLETSVFDELSAQPSTLIFLFHCLDSGVHFTYLQ